MKVMTDSMIAVSGSATILYETWTRPASNQVASGVSMREAPPASWASAQKAITQAPTEPASTGRWLCCFRNRGPNSPATTAPTSGRLGISQRTQVSDMTLLAAPGGLGPGRDEVRLRQPRRRRRQRLGIDGRLLARLAQVLPQAHVQRLAPPVEHQDERQRQARLAGRHRDDEQREHLPLQVAVLPGEGDEVER